METKSRKKLITVLTAVLLPVVLAAGILIFYTAEIKKDMQALAADGLAAVQAHSTVQKLDAGAYADIRLGSERVHVEQYAVSGLGNLAVKTSHTALTHSVSFVLTPFGKNVPLCALHETVTPGKRKTSAAFYDLVGDTATPAYQQVTETLRLAAVRYADAEELAAEPHWYDSFLSTSLYKQFRGKEKPRSREMFLDMLNAYLAVSGQAEPAAEADAARQFEITQNFCSSLIEKGSAETDLFRDTLGAEETLRFFYQVYFGTDCNREYAPS